MYYIGEIHGQTFIFGEGNSKRTAVAAGEWNANTAGAVNCRIVRKLPAGAKWLPILGEYTFQGPAPRDWDHV